MAGFGKGGFGSNDQEHKTAGVDKSDLMVGDLTISNATSITYNKTVFCTLQVEGIHNWPDCPYNEVDYLRSPHRHMFHIKAYYPVSHSDRDVEFIMLQHRIESYLKEKYGVDIKHPTGWPICDGKVVCEFGSMSCEMIAEELIVEFKLSSCEVSEDGENGAYVSVCNF